jgi:hypothetical protein
VHDGYRRRQISFAATTETIATEGSDPDRPKSAAFLNGTVAEAGEKKTVAPSREKNLLFAGKMRARYLEDVR